MTKKGKNNYKNNYFVFYDCSDSYYKFPTLFLDYNGNTLVKAIKIGRHWHIETGIDTPFSFLFVNDDKNFTSIESCKKYIMEKMKLFTKDYLFTEIKTLKQK